MKIFRNGNDWTIEELTMLVMYKTVKIEHLCVLIPNQTSFDIERKINELNEENIKTIEDLSNLTGEAVKW